MFSEHRRPRAESMSADSTVVIASGSNVSTQTQSSAVISLLDEVSFDEFAFSPQPVHPVWYAHQ